MTSGLAVDVVDIETLANGREKWMLWDGADDMQSQQL